VGRPEDDRFNAILACRVVDDDDDDDDDEIKERNEGVPSAAASTR
jgi:hypothetical protein